MGCFSFKCLECGRGVRSSSFDGDMVHLFLLKKGEIVQKMTGKYNSYGSVFIKGTQRKDVKHELMESQKWNDPFPEKSSTDHDKYFQDRGDDHWIWHRVCDLMHDEKDFTNGMAAIHVRCYKKDPTHRSPNDPDQGWGPRKKKVDGYEPLKELRTDQLRQEMWRLKDSMMLSIIHAIDLKTGKVDPFMKKISDQKKRKFSKMKKEYLELGGEKVDWMEKK